MQGPVEAMGEDVWVGTPVATTKAKVFLREKTADLGGDTESPRLLRRLHVRLQMV